MPPRSEKRREANAHVAEFIARLYGIGGFKSWAEFGREAGGFSGEQMSDWKRGENAPSGYNLLRLIWAAERRHEDARVFAGLMTDPIVGAGIRVAQELAASGSSPAVSDEGSVPAPVMTVDRLQALEEQVRVTGRETARVIRALTRAIERLEHQQGAEAQATTEASSGRRR